jgi:biopolymer transport protein ExbD
MLTTTFGKPKTMEINMPVKGPNNKPSEVTNAMTVLLSGDNKIYWYFGSLKPETTLSTSDFSNDGLRKLLLEKNKIGFDKIKQLRAEAAKKNLADSTLKRMEVDIKGEKTSLMVLIKTDDKAKFKNVIDALDELNICMIGKYAIVDLGKQEYDLINNFKPAN